MAAAEERGLFAQTLFRWAAINPAAEGNSNIACSVSWWLTLRPSRFNFLVVAFDMVTDEFLVSPKVASAASGLMEIRK